MARVSNLLRCGIVFLLLSLPALAGAQEADPLELPPTSQDAVEQRVQRELDAAEERFDVILAGALEPAAGGEEVRVDLAGAVELALRRNPSLAAVEERRGELAAGVREAKADAFPQLTATASYSRSRNPSFLNSPDFEDILAQFPSGDFVPSEQRLYSTALELSQPLYTFGKIGSAIELARVLVDAVEAQIGAARLDTALDAAEAYYEVLSAREELVVGLAQRRARREALEVVRARYEIGEATRLELLRAQSALAEVTPDIAGRAGDLSVARSRLRKVLGLEAGVALRVEGGVDVTLPRMGSGEGEEGAAADGPAEPPPAAAGPRHTADLPPVPELAELSSAARAHRPEIADLELQRQALRKQQEVARAEGLPQVDLVGSYGRQARLYENLGDPLFVDYSVALGVRWEFFDGGRRKGQIARLESQRQQLAYQLDDLLGRIRLDLEESLAAYRTALERWRSAETAAAAAREASRVARESYREGVALQTDWLDAQRQETEAEILAVETYYDARTEAVRLARAVGAYPTEGWTVVEE